MCGIGGLFLWNGATPDRSVLRHMGGRMAHRGRDGDGVFQAPGFGLVHRRLAIIDPVATADQPMLSVDGRLVVVFNGEITNYIELRDELLAEGVVLRTRSDTEVLLHLWRRYGCDMLSRLEGMFAIALADLDRQVLFLARDRMGIKPLYYASDSRQLMFASEAKALFGAGLASASIDPIGLCDYLNLQLYTPGQTLFAGVRELTPGHFMLVSQSDRSLQPRCWWRMPTDEQDISIEDAEVELARLIDDAVRRWSRADVPIAAYVSGGIDSSAVTTLASRYINPSLQDRLETFSSVWTGIPFPDEGKYADAVATAAATRHHHVAMRREEIAQAHEGIFYGLDNPVAGYAAPSRVMAAHVRSHVKVALTGHGGDELFGGYPKYAAATLAWELGQHMQGRPVPLSTKPLPWMRGFEKQARQIFGNCLFTDERTILRSMFDRSGLFWNDVRPDVRAAAGGWDPYDRLAEMIGGRETGFLKKLIYLDSQVLLPGLLHVEDRMTMLENLEVRPPLLDKPIIEFAARLPSELLFAKGLKGVLREAVRPILPAELYANPSKSGTLYPIAFLVDHELKPYIDADLDYLDRSGLFVRPAREMLAGQDELMNRRKLWALWSLGGWMRAFGITV